MSPRTRITREQWLAAMSALLGQGLVPADIPLSELCERMGVTKGSFYSHFPGGLEELHREIIDRWQRESGADGLAATMQAIRDPQDRLRLLRARALQTAQRDGAMRRWGARDPAAAAVVARADVDMLAHSASALQDLGLTGAEAVVMAAVLVHAFAGAHHASAAAPQSDPARFEMLLGILTRAATARTGQAAATVDVTAGSAPDEVVLFTIARDLPAEARRKLRDQAQRFAAQVAAPPVHSSRTSPQARPKRTSGNAGA
jgi:AcrR family transcriptional regulator